MSSRGNNKSLLNTGLSSNTIYPRFWNPRINSTLKRKVYKRTPLEGPFTQSVYNKAVV